MREKNEGAAAGWWPQLEKAALIVPRPVPMLWVAAPRDVGSFVFKILGRLALALGLSRPDLVLSWPQRCAHHPRGAASSPYSLERYYRARHMRILQGPAIFYLLLYL